MAGCFTLIVMWLSVFCVSSLGAMGWSIVSEFGISRPRGYKAFFMLNLAEQ